MSANATKLFSSQYCEFLLPTGWQCALEGTEWVCQSSNADRKKEAIIILGAKMRGTKDSLAEYQAYLTKPKTYRLPGGQTQVSEPKYVNANTVNGHRWIDSLHMASEVPGFYTRYMATVKEDLGIAVTFSVAKDFYDSYRPVFDRVIQTLKVFRQKSVDPSKYKLANKKDDSLIGDLPEMGQGNNVAGIGYNQQKQKSGSGGAASDYIMYAVIAGAAGFALMKMRKKKGGTSSAPKKKKKKKE